MTWIGSVLLQLSFSYSFIPECFSIRGIGILRIMKLVKVSGIGWCGCISGECLFYFLFPAPVRIWLLENERLVSLRKKDLRDSSFLWFSECLSWCLRKFITSILKIMEAIGIFTKQYSNSFHI